MASFPFVFLPFLAVLLLTRGAAGAEPPQPPCRPGDTPVPSYASEEALPAVRVWQDLVLPAEPGGEAGCFGGLSGAMNTVVALAGRFRFAGGAEGLAARFGAVSQTVGEVYWSTTDQAWRSLFSEAFALSRADTEFRRPDFTAAEVRSGDTLYFAQNDTRSTGLNVYRLRALAAEEDRLVVEVANVSAIGLTFVTLFQEEGLLSLHFLERLDGDLWGYYALAAVREGSVAGDTKSVVNRAVAFYRFLRGVPGDEGAPLAR